MTHNHAPSSCWRATSTVTVPSASRVDVRASAGQRQDRLRLVEGDKTLDIALIEPPDGEAAQVFGAQRVFPVRIHIADAASEV